MYSLFAYPWLLAASGLLVVLGLLAWRGTRLRRRALAELAGGLRQPGHAGIRLRRLRCAFLVLGLVLLCVGSAGPQWGRDWDQSAAPGRDLVVVLDRSRSMLAEQPSRLERARSALLELADFLKKRGAGHRLALVTFAGQARLVCPLTHDYDHFREVVDAIDPQHVDSDLAALAGAVSGTRIGQALQLAVQALTESTGGTCDILLLSDGDDPARDGEYREGITAARSAHIPVFTVGLGDPDQDNAVPLAYATAGRPRQMDYEGQPVTTRLDEGTLREIARDTGGTYEPARRQTPPLGPLYLEMIAGQPIRDDAEDSLPVYRQRPQWSLTPALVLLVLATVLGDGRSTERRT